MPHRRGGKARKVTAALPGEEEEEGEGEEEEEKGMLVAGMTGLQAALLVAD